MPASNSSQRVRADCVSISYAGPTFTRAPLGARARQAVHFVPAPPFFGVVFVGLFPVAAVRVEAHGGLDPPLAADRLRSPPATVEVEGGPGNAPLGAGGRNGPLGFILSAQKSPRIPIWSGLGELVVVSIWGSSCVWRPGHTRGSAAGSPGTEGPRSWGGPASAQGSQEGQVPSRAAVRPGARRAGATRAPTPDAEGTPSTRSPQPGRLWPRTAGPGARPKGSGGPERSRGLWLAAPPA